MNRRTFISQAMKQGVAGTAAVSAVLGASLKPHVAKARDLAEAKMDALEARVDKLEHHHKNLLRVGAICFAISTGVDLTLLG